MGIKWAVHALLVFGTFYQAAASTGMMLPESQRPKNRYQCSPPQKGVQNIDLLVNGGNERFQGIARVRDGKVVEVSGVVSSYAMQANGVPVVTQEEESKLWARWIVYNQVLSRFMLEKYNKENPKAANYFIADDADEKPAKGARAIKPGEYPGQAAGSSSGGMMGGFGFVGAFGGGGKPASTGTEVNVGNPYGGGFGGGIFGIGMGMGAQVTAEDLAEVDRRVDLQIKKNELRLQRKLAREQEQRAFQPPPAPPAATAAPRLADNLPEPPGHIIGRQQTLGDRIAAERTPGDRIAAELTPGQKASMKPRPGDIAALKTAPSLEELARARPPVPLRRGDEVEERRGALIGREGVYNFSAEVNPQTGKIQYAHRTNAQNFTQLVVQNGQARNGDSQLSVINQFVAQAQRYADCCRQDSQAKCDIKYDPKSQEALARFKEVANNPGAVLRGPSAHQDEGGAMFNPFGGSRPKPGVYGPANGPAPGPAKGAGTQR